MKHALFPALAAVVALASQPALADSTTCGVAHPYDTQHYDGFMQRVVGCEKDWVDAAWSRYHMGEGEDGWLLYGGDDRCNVNTPAGRAINALHVLDNAGRFSTCDTGGPILDMAFCWSGQQISYLKPACDPPAARTVAQTWYGLQIDADNRTELYRTFFYETDVVSRAATIFHEARHAHGFCSHTDNCGAGKNACDPNFTDGCVGFASGSGKGAYAYTVLYLSWFVFSGTERLKNQFINENSVLEANARLMENFEQDPCFRIAADGRTMLNTCP